MVQERPMKWIEQCPEGKRMPQKSQIHLVLAVVRLCRASPSYQRQKCVKLISTQNEEKCFYDTYNVDLDCPVGNVTISGSQTLLNKNPACCDAPGTIGNVLIIGNVCVGVETAANYKGILR